MKNFKVDNYEPLDLKKDLIVCVVKLDFVDFPNKSFAKIHVPNASILSCGHLLFHRTELAEDPKQLCGHQHYVADVVHAYAVFENLVYFLYKWK